MATEKRSRSAPSRASGTAPRAPRRRIPLPPLPSRSPGVEDPAPAPRAASASRRFEETADDDAAAQEALLAGIDLAPPDNPEGRSPNGRVAAESELARTGAIGASVMNDLVDEIERDLEKEAARHAPVSQPVTYGRSVGCTYSRR